MSEKPKFVRILNRKEKDTDLTLTPEQFIEFVQEWLRSNPTHRHKVICTLERWWEWEWYNSDSGQAAGNG